APVGPVARARELVGGDGLVGDADVVRHATGAVELAGRDGGRDRGDGERPVAQRAPRDGGDDARVDAPGKGDDRAAEGPAAPLQFLKEGHARTSCAAARARAHTVFTGSPLIRAARSQSACSGARLTTRPPSRPTLIRTGSPPTSTVQLSRSSSI